MSDAGKREWRFYLDDMIDFAKKALAGSGFRGHAGAMAKVRHLLVEVIGNKVRWEKVAVRVKKDNLKRPAFQQAFTDRVPGWRELVAR